MRLGSAILPSALVIAIALATSADAQQAKKPWEYVKELIEKSPFKPRKGSGNSKASSAATPKADVGAATAVIVPIPRKRPPRRGVADATGGPARDAPAAAAPVSAPIRDFDAAFAPPAVLKLPDRDTQTPATEPPVGEIAATSAEPEPIVVGRGAAVPDASARFPFPRARPEHRVEPLAMLPKEEEQAAAPSPAPPPAPRTPPPSVAACVSGLAALGVDAAPLAPVSEGACRVSAPASIVSFENGDVELPVKALVNCETAATAARWLRDSVQPAASEELGARVTGLRIAASYDCRSRNHVPGAKLSEHAYGNAIDFGAFRVNGRWIEVGGKHETDELRFFARIRDEACGPFKTVLGPGSDGYHTDHIHLDLARRRTAGPSKGLYCK